MCCKKFVNLTLRIFQLLHSVGTYVFHFIWHLHSTAANSTVTFILYVSRRRKTKQSFYTDLLCAGQDIMKIHQCVMERRMMLLKKCFLSVTDCPGRSNSTCNNPPVNGARPNRAVGTGGRGDNSVPKTFHRNLSKTLATITFHFYQIVIIQTT